MRIGITLIVTLLVTIAISPAVMGLTAAIGNARMILRPEIPEGKSVVIEKTIELKNLNNIPVIVELSVEDSIADLVTLLDNNVTVAPNQSVHAKFLITLTYGGTYEGRILARFSPADPEVQDNPVGLSSTIIIQAAGPQAPPEVLRRINDSKASAIKSSSGQVIDSLKVANGTTNLTNNASHANILDEVNRKLNQSNVTGDSAELIAKQGTQSNASGISVRSGNIPKEIQTSSAQLKTAKLFSINTILATVLGIAMALIIFNIYYLTKNRK